MSNWWSGVSTLKTFGNTLNFSSDTLGLMVEGQVLAGKNFPSIPPASWQVSNPPV